MAIKVRRLGPGRLTLTPAGSQTGITDFSSQVEGCQLIPTVDKGDRRYVLSGESLAGTRKEKLEMKGKLVPDFGEASSLQEWCWTNRGKDFSFEFVPDLKAGRKLLGKVTVEAVAIGQDQVKSDEGVDFSWECFDTDLATHTPT